MKYSITANSIAKAHATIGFGDNELLIGTSAESGADLPNPAEILLNALAACILKNVERLSVLQRFEYTKANITVTSTRKSSPTRMDDIEYQLTIYSKESINTDLLHRNIEEHGTIYNTIKRSAAISGTIQLINDYV